MTKTFNLSEIEAAIIENVRNNEKYTRKRKLSRDVSVAVKPCYFASPQDTICEVLRNRIVDNGFIAPEFNEVGATDSGSQAYDLQGCYLAVTWYRMQSGHFEIIAYVS